MDSQNESNLVTIEALSVNSTEPFVRQIGKPSFWMIKTENPSWIHWAKFARKRAVRFMPLAVLPIVLSIFATEEPASPLTPKQEQASFHLADTALRIELVASEPNVVSP